MTTPQNIMVATDFSACSDEAVRHGFELAEKLGAKVHLVHVVSMEVLPLETLSHETLGDAEMLAEQKLRAIAKSWRATGRVGEVRTPVGEPAAMILLMSEQIGADLIVLGTHGRRGIRRLLVGSVAESVVREAACPVTVVRHHEEEDGHAHHAYLRRWATDTQPPMKR